MAAPVLFMLVTLACVPSQGDGADVAIGVLDVNRLVLASVYFLSGVAKCHHRFLVEEDRLFVRAFGELLGVHGPVVPATLAGLETMLALGLLHPRTRVLSVIGLAGMHLTILALIGPWWQNHNPVVWPWNVVMIALLFGLYWRDGTRPLAILWPRPKLLRYAALLVLGVPDWWTGERRATAVRYTVAPR